MGVYIRGTLRMFKNKPPPPVWAISTAKMGGGAYFQDDTLLSKFLTLLQILFLSAGRSHCLCKLASFNKLQYCTCTAMHIIRSLVYWTNRTPNSSRSWSGTLSEFRLLVRNFMQAANLIQRVKLPYRLLTSQSVYTVSGCLGSRISILLSIGLVQRCQF